MYTVGAPPGAGTLCIRSPFGKISAAAAPRLDEPVSYLARTSDDGPEYRYAGAVDPDVARLEIVGNGTGSIVSQPYIGQPEAPRNDLLMKALGGGWHSFSLPVFSPRWKATLLAYNAGGEIIEQINLP